MTGHRVEAAEDERAGDRSAGVRRGPTTRLRVHEVDGDLVRRHEDHVTTEEPMQIRLRTPGGSTEPVVVTMRTPGADFELAVGFLRAEGLITSASDIRRVAYCTDADLRPEERYNVVTVDLAGPPRRAPAPRYGAMSSACGVCGKQSLDDLGDAGLSGRVGGRWRVTRELLTALPDRVRAAQNVFSRTGGLHASGLFAPDETMHCVREDVGRHNALDKVIGWALLHGCRLDDAVLAVSGRAGFEIVQKAAAVGIPLIAAVGAPSSLSVDLAERTGITLVGFLRGQRFVIYTEPSRIELP